VDKKVEKVGQNGAKSETYSLTIKMLREAIRTVKRKVIALRVRDQTHLKISEFSE
jgi:hypothetical protein